MAVVNMSSSCMSTRTHLPKPPPPFSRTLPSLLLFPSSSSHVGSRTGTHVAHARKGVSSRNRRLENRGKKGSLTTKPEQEEGEVPGGGESRMGELDGPPPPYLEGGIRGAEMSSGPMPELPGLEPALFEGSQWDALGFVVQYLWAFGFVFALIACGIAVATYNDGATDFKQTAVYKESIQSRELLEEPDSSTSDVFEGNPTEVAPSLE